MAVAIPNKSAETIVKTYMDHVYSIFGDSSRMLTENGSKFKNKKHKVLYAELFNFLDGIDFFWVFFFLMKCSTSMAFT